MAEDDVVVAPGGAGAVEPTTEVRKGSDGAPGRAGAPLSPRDETAQPARPVTSRPGATARSAPARADAGRVRAATAPSERASAAASDEAWCSVAGTARLSPGTTYTPSPHEVEIDASLTGCTGGPESAAASGTLRQLSGTCTPAADTPMEGTIELVWADRTASTLEISVVLDSPHSAVFHGRVTDGRLAGQAFSGDVSIVSRDSFDCALDPIERADFVGQVSFGRAADGG